MKNTVNWGVLGNAWIARDFMIPALEKSEICVVAAVASRSQIPEELAPNAKHYSSYEALLQDPDIDVVYVPVPNALHMQWAIRAMEAGKHVLCEKPLCCTEAEARQMVAAAEKNGVLLMEAFMYRYGPKFTKAMEIIDSGVLGPIKFMQGCHGYTLTWASPAREDPLLGGGSLYDVGCYVVDCMNAIMARQGAKLCAASAVLGEKDGADRNAAGWLQYDNGVTGVVQSWFDAASEQRMLIAGEKGTLTVPNMFKGAGGEMYLSVGGKTETITVPGVNCMQLEAEAFSRTVLGGKDERIPLAHSLANMAALDMLYRR